MPDLLVTFLGILIVFAAGVAAGRRFWRSTGGVSLAPAVVENAASETSVERPGEAGGAIQTPYRDLLQSCLDEINELPPGGLLIIERDSFKTAAAIVADSNLTESELFTFAESSRGAFTVASGAIRLRGITAAGILRLVTGLRSVTDFGIFHDLNALGTAQDPTVGRQVLLNLPWRYSPLFREALERFAADRLERGDALTLGPEIVRMDPQSTTALLEFLAIAQIPALDALKEEAGFHRFRSFVGEFGRTRDLKTAAATPLVEHDALTGATAQVESALLGPQRKPVLVVGERGCGKSTLIEHVARRRLADGWFVLEAGAADLLSGQVKIGDLEQRVKDLLRGLATYPNCLWIVPNFQHLTLIGKHQYSNISLIDMISGALERGLIHVIGEASLASLDAIRAASPNVHNSMELVRVEPLPLEQCLVVARQWSMEAGTSGQPLIDSADLQEASNLARQYLGERASPGDLMDLLSLARRSVIAAGRERIDMEVLLDVLSQLTGLPRTILDHRQGLDLDRARQFFESRVLGQPEAVECLVDRIAMIKAGLTDPARPQGVLLFAGPTGTGKTELAKALAAYLFGSASRMFRIDMSELQTPASLSRIVGVPGEYTACLTAQIRAEPFSVILLDEFEKAHPQVWDMFLQVFDDGRLTDASGSTADFRHAIVLMTSNVGARSSATPDIGFAKRDPNSLADGVRKAIGMTFRPEFINRLDRIVVFRPLSRAVMREVLQKELRAVLDLRGIRSQTWAVEWESSAIEFLLDKGFTPDLGARPLKRAIERYVLAPLAAAIVTRQVPQGDQFLFVRASQDRITVEFIDPDQPPESGLDLTARLGLPFDESEEEEASTEPAELRTVRQIALSSYQEATDLAVLREIFDQVGARVASEEWAERKQECLDAMRRPGFWEWSGRISLLDDAEFMDRLETDYNSARSTLNRLGRSRGATSQRSPLVESLALRAYLLHEGLLDFDGKRPREATILVEARPEVSQDSAEADAFAVQLANMYEQWAAKRFLRYERKRLGPPAPFGAIAFVSGFGAYALIQGETGLHVLESPREPQGVRRTVARVRVLPGTQASFEKADDSAMQVVRSYREKPSPLVRDRVKQWRTGKFQQVMEGAFDLFERDGAG